MATENTPNKTFRCINRKRLTTQDAEDFAKLAALLDENHHWSLLADHPLVVCGWDLQHSIDRIFEISVGMGLVEGVLAKSTSAQTVQLDDNAVGGAARIDLIELLPRAAGSDPLPACLSETASDSQTEVTLSAITRTQVVGFAVGTGDGATKAFDLGSSGVDFRTLKVQVAAVPVGGWNLSPGTGAAGVDQIIFGDAPALGAAITADYYWQAGGVESAAAAFTRYTRDLSFNIVKGTPGGGMPAWTAGSIHIASIQVPNGWTGGSGSVVIDNTVKQFMVHADQSVEPASPGVSPYSGRLITPIRNMDQVLHGCRLRYESSNTIVITPGWGSLGGVSFRNPGELAYQLPAVGSTGWYYVYGIIAPTSSTSPPGEIISAEISTNPPDNLRDRPSQVGRVYLGAVYLTAITPVIRPFYSHGDQVWWQEPQDIFPGSPATQDDIDISVWCPATGRLVNALVEVGHNEGVAAGSYTRIRLHSHIYDGEAEAFSFPQIRGEVSAPILGVLYYNTAAGWVRAEESAGNRYVHYHYATTGTPEPQIKQVYIQGYLDDYRTMDDTGSPTFY